MKSQDFKASEIIDSAKAVLASDLISRAIPLDQSAETMYEIMAKTGHGRAEARKQISNLVKEGKLEQVWKQTGRGVSMAYRAKKIS